MPADATLNHPVQPNSSDSSNLSDSRGLADSDARALAASDSRDLADSDSRDLPASDSRDLADSDSRDLAASDSPDLAASERVTRPSLPRFDENIPRPVPPVEQQDGTTLTRLVGVMRRLLAPDGCPWDREQSFETLRKYALEEACEVIDAIDSGDRGAIREELGDLLLQVVFQSELGRAEGAFAIDDVVSGIVEKLVHRHPHVFGDMNVSDADEVLRNWELIKAKEKGERGILGGVPRSLPALTRAQRIGEKVGRVGFDWPDARGSRAKVNEELEELDRAVESKDPKAIEEELGDVLFALVNLARHVDVDAEGALRRTIDKFTSRFAHVEGRVKAVHAGWGNAGGGTLSLEVLDTYWDEAKALEKAKG